MPLILFDFSSHICIVCNAMCPSVCNRPSLIHASACLKSANAASFMSHPPYRGSYSGPGLWSVVLASGPPPGSLWSVAPASGPGLRSRPHAPVFPLVRGPLAGFPVPPLQAILVCIAKLHSQQLPRLVACTSHSHSRKCYKLV